MCDRTTALISRWDKYSILLLLFSLSRRSQVYTVYGFTMYYSICPGGLKCIQFMGLQCTIFSIQGDSVVYSLWVYNVLYSICPGGLNCIQFMGLQCTVLSVQADSSAYSSWVYNVLFYLPRRTPVYTACGSQCTILSVQADGSVCSAWTQRREVLASTTTWAW